MNNTSIILLAILPYFVKYNEIPTFSLTDTAAHISNKVFQSDQAISILWWCDNPDKSVDTFLKKYIGSYILSPLKREWDKVKQIHNVTQYRRVVLFANEPEDFEAAITRINKVIVSPLRLILVILQSTKEKELENYTQIAWENDVGDIIIISKESDESKVTLMTYFPYSEGVCANYKPVKLNQTQDNLFPKKFTNFYGCPIRVTLLHFIPYVSLTFDKEGNLTNIGGIDGNIYRLVAEKHNATSLIVRTEDHGGMGNFKNGSGTGSFGDLTDGVSDIFAPAGVLNINRYAGSQISHVYKTLDVFWYAPNQREIYTWAKVILPFINKATGLICLAFIIFVTIAIFIKYHTRPSDKKSVVFLAYGLFMGQEMKFEINSRLFNSVFVLWIWFCQIVRIKYQDDLIAGLQNQILEPRYETLVQAMEGVDEYGGVEIFGEFYRNTTYEKDFKVISMSDVQHYIHDISDGKKRFLLASDVILVHLLRKKLQRLDAPISLAHTCLYMRPRWPAAPEVDRTIQNIISSGYLNKIINDYTFQWSLTENNTHTENDAIAINMTMISACFIGLMSLWLACFFVFLVEVLYHRHSQKI